MASGGGEETRVTKVTQMVNRIQAPGESCLVQIYGPDLGKKYPLADDEITIGRDSKNQVVVDLDNVSRKHARLTSRDSKCFVVDLGSTNGTFVNGEKIKKVRLKEGDRILIGTSIIKLVAVDGSQQITEEKGKESLRNAGQRGGGPPEHAQHDDGGDADGRGAAFAGTAVAADLASGRTRRGRRMGVRCGRCGGHCWAGDHRRGWAAHGVAPLSARPPHRRPRGSHRSPLHAGE